MQGDRHREVHIFRIFTNGTNNIFNEKSDHFSLKRVKVKTLSREVMIDSFPVSLVTNVFRFSIDIERWNKKNARKEEEKIPITKNIHVCWNFGQLFVRIND